MKIGLNMSRTSLAALLVLAASGIASAGAVVPGFSGTTFPGNDDGSTGLVGMGFTANFFGTSYSSLYVNNNGNVTFDAPLGAFTHGPGLVHNAQKILDVLKIPGAAA